MSKKNYPSVPGLTHQQVKFVHMLRSDPNRAASKAYMGAYERCKSIRSAETNASRLLKNAKVVRYLHQLDQEALEEARLDGDTVTKIKGAIATFDPRRLVHPDGQPKELHELDEDIALAIEEMTVVIEIDPETKALRKVAKFKWAKKAPVLDQLSRQFGQYEKDNDQRGKGMAELFDRVDGATRGIPGKDDGEGD